MICFAISDYSLACFLGYLGGCFQDAEDLALLGLLFGGVGNVQAALHLLFFFHSLDHDPVVQRSNLHVGTSTHNFVGLRIWSRLTAARRFRDNIISTLTP